MKNQLDVTCYFISIIMRSTENKTNDGVIHQQSRRPLKMDILMSETCWAHNNWNKITSDIKLVFHSSTIRKKRLSIIVVIRLSTFGCPGLSFPHTLRRTLVPSSGPRLHFCFANHALLISVPDESDRWARSCSSLTTRKLGGSRSVSISNWMMIEYRFAPSPAGSFRFLPWPCCFCCCCSWYGYQKPFLEACQVQLL